MWMWLIALASGGAPLDIDAVEAFVAFHCSDDNVPRLATPLALAPLPEGVPPSRVRHAPVRRMLVVGADGALDGPSRENPQQADAVWVHPDLPSAQAAAVLAQIAEGRTGTVPLLFASTHVPPRPDEPVGGVDVELQLLRTRLASDDRPRASKRCMPPSKLPPRCGAHARDLIERLQKKRCAPEAHLALAQFAHRFDRGAPGHPVALVDVPVAGATPLGEAGTWATDHAAFVRHPTAGLRPSSEAASGPPFGLWKEVDPPEEKRRVDPRAPNPRQMGTCLARVFIDERGVPVHVEVSDCSDDLHASTVEALMQWRWYPVQEGSERIKAQTVITVRYL